MKIQEKDGAPEYIPASQQSSRKTTSFAGVRHASHIAVGEKSCCFHKVINEGISFAKFCFVFRIKKVDFVEYPRCYCGDSPGRSIVRVGSGFFHSQHGNKMTIDAWIFFYRIKEVPILLHLVQGNDTVNILPYSKIAHLTI